MTECWLKVVVEVEGIWVVGKGSVCAGMFGSEIEAVTGRGDCRIKGVELEGSDGIGVNGVASAKGGTLFNGPARSASDEGEGEGNGGF